MLTLLFMFLITLTTSFVYFQSIQLTLAATVTAVLFVYFFGSKLWKKAQKRERDQILKELSESL